MPYQTETMMPREAMSETKDLFNIVGKIPPEQLYGFIQFMRGVSFGLDMSGIQKAPPPGA